MASVYKTIDMLLHEHGISGAKMSSDLGMSRSFMTELRSGRAKSITAETAQKIANYFGVSVGYLLGTEQDKKPLINDDEELTGYLDELRSRPEKRMLFSVTKNATKAQIEAIVKMIEEMKGD